MLIGCMGSVAVLSSQKEGKPLPGIGHLGQVRGQIVVAHRVESIGVHNWTGTIAYRYLVPMSNKRASVLLGPTAGYWINNDNGSWITIGGTLQSELLWTGSVDYGLFVGLVLVHNETLNDDVPSEFDAGIHFGGKIVF